MAATLIQNQLFACNCNSHYRPRASTYEATPFSIRPTASFVTLSGALSATESESTAVGSVRIPIESKTVSSLAEPFRSFRDRSSSSRSIFANVPKNSTPLLFGRSRGLTKMEVGLVAEEANSSRRVPVVKATNKVVIMVDPVEAKRLAAAEMKAIEARAKIKRRKEIEAINGGWAVLGLTAGIVIDGYTGKSILLQIAGYLDAIADLLTPLIPS